MCPGSALVYSALACFRLCLRHWHTGVTFDAENDRPGPGSLRSHFEAAYVFVRNGQQYPVWNGSML